MGRIAASIEAGNAGLANDVAKTVALCQRRAGSRWVRRSRPALSPAKLS